MADNNVDWANDLIDKNEDTVAYIQQWWEQQSTAEAKSIAPKAYEYGQQSLINLGSQLVQFRGENPKKYSDAQLMFTAVWFYVNGKIQRWNDAAYRGLAVSDDTLHDLACYIKMAQYIRKHGTWVGNAWDG